MTDDRGWPYLVLATRCLSGSRISRRSARGFAEPPRIRERAGTEANKECRAAAHARIDLRRVGPFDIPRHLAMDDLRNDFANFKNLSFGPLPKNVERDFCMTIMLIVRNPWSSDSRKCRSKSGVGDIKTNFRVSRFREKCQRTK